MAQNKLGHASPLRYPGGKGALANFVKHLIAENQLFDGHYVEVYAGGAGIAWKLLFEEYVQKIHINDLNKSVMAFWNSVLDETEELCRLIHDTKVTVEEWEKQRNIQNHPDEYSLLQLGYSTFFLNRANRSGILKGGIIGGKDQTGEWKIDARFNKASLIERIKRIAKYKTRISTYNLDAELFIRNILPGLPQKTLIYLDPPYYKKGQQLYENHYNPQDHQAIATLIDGIQQSWLVSYDSCPEINALYSHHRNIQYNINYSARDRYAGSEVIFFSDSLKIPQIANPIGIKSPSQQLSLM